MAYFFKRLGFVYFAKHPHLDVVKIGFSLRPAVRVRELSFNGRYGIFNLLHFICNLPVPNSQ